MSVATLTLPRLRGVAIRLGALLVTPAGDPVPARAAAAPVSATTEAAADPDLALTGRARDGDAEAFRQLVERHRDRAYAVARRIVRFDADAEEVAQDAFVRAWKALPGFRGESRFSTWLHRIVVRQALDRAETLARRRGREAALDDAPAAVAAVADAATDFEATHRARRLETLVDGLTPAQRAAVTLYYHEDHSVERTAELLQLPVNTVKTHLRRAREALRTGWLAQEETP